MNLDKEYNHHSSSNQSVTTTAIKNFVCPDGHPLYGMTLPFTKPMWVRYDMINKTEQDVKRLVLYDISTAIYREMRQRL